MIDFFYRYYELIKKPLQTLIERINETSADTEVNSNDSAKMYHTIHSNGYSNSAEFLPDAKQSEPLMIAKHVGGEIHECTNSFERLSFENGYDTSYYSSVYVSGDRNGTSNANVLSTDRIEQTSIEAQFNGNGRYYNEDSLPNDGQFIASHQSNDLQSHEDHIHGQEINKLPHGMGIDSFPSTNDTVAFQSNQSLQPASDTIQERYHNFDAENNCIHQYTDGHLCDSNYKLVMEAIVQLENDNRIDQQQMNIQSTDITTTIDSQMNTPVREHLQTAAANQNITIGNGIGQMITSVSEEPSSNAKKSGTIETLNIPLSYEIANKTDLTKRPGKYIILYHIRCSTMEKVSFIYCQTIHR